jgi:tripeptide aminopeptidase
MTTKTALRVKRPAKPSPASSGLEPNLKQATGRVLELMAISGTSGHEESVADFIRQQLLSAGAAAADIRTDEAHLESPLRGGAMGNLLFRMPGTLRGPRRMLMAHLDTVPLCVGAKPVLKGGIVRSADKTTGLGADDRAGCAVVLTAALEILRRGLPHPPLVFFWPVQEEVGLYGSHYADLKLLNKPQLAFNWDGGPAAKVTIGATGAYRMTITVSGLASHAGAAPELGVSAVAIAGLAIADLQRGGWLGDVRRAGRRGTSNIGVIRGGAATNVVTDHVELRAEARSHDRRFRREILRTFERAFAAAAESISNAMGVTGQAKVASRLDYEAFQLPADEPCVLAAEAAVRSIGAEPARAISNGGLDANWLSARGIPTVTLGCGQMNAHTLSERLDLAAFHQACRIALRLATGTEA